MHMEKIISILNNKFGDKYNDLKLLDVVFDKSSNLCTISFLYPETSQALKTENKQEIANFLTDTLKLNAKLVIKFKKSFLDEELIRVSIKNYFLKFQRSLSSVIDFKKITISKNVFDIKISIIIPEAILKNVNQEKVKTNLIEELNKEFIADFSCEFFPGENIDEATLKNKIEKTLLERSKHIEITPRYKVFSPEVVIGPEITPEPEFLANIKDSKSNVILAGRIEKFEKKTYKRTRKNVEVEKTYYKFTLKDDSRYLNMVYFCPQSNIKKMDKLCDGDSVLVIADIKKEKNFLNGYLRRLSLCEINNEVKKKYKQKITSYTTVFPVSYYKTSQSTMFDKPVRYNNNIMNNCFVVFDTETTGLDPLSCEIIEIGAVKVVGGQIIEKFQSLVKPLNTISEEITNINGIDNDMVANAPSIENVIKDFYLFAKDSVLAGYNVNFDMKFIQNAGKKFGVNFNNEILDVYPLAQEKVVSTKYNLGTIVKVLELTLDNAHRALFDAIATAEVLLKLSTVEE